MTRFFFAFLLLLPLLVGAQNRFTISGTITDAESEEQMIGATVVNLRTGEGVVTNNYGFYSLTLASDTVHLAVSYVGYQAVDTLFKLKKDERMDIRLPMFGELAEVEVNAERSERIEERVQMSQVTVPIEQIKHIPALFGEVDVLKALQLLPGVQAGGEGQNGLYVRGGSPDQNLILLDGVPVYNVSHLLGFFSVFNADALKNVTLTKGGYPARYGGRLSSVLELNMKEGNMREWHGVGSIGAISSRLTLEGPIVKDKVSMIVSARRTYVDVVASPLIKYTARSEGVDAALKLYFYDLNSKVNWRINDKHRVFLSGYFGRDVFGLESNDSSFGSTYNTQAGTNWGNSTLALRWNWMLSNKMFSNVTATRSRFDFDLSASVEEGQGDEITRFASGYTSGIVDHGVRWDIDYAPSPKHYIRFGASMVQHSYNPGAFQLDFSDGQEFEFDTLIGSNNIKSLDGFLYLEDEITLGPLKANIGMHVAGFWVDSVFYPSFQPRLGLNLPITKNWSAKASFAKMTQFINLLTNESLSLPTDLWVPSTSSLKPQESWQVAAGVARTFGKDYEFSVEGYYKDMQNVVSYKEGATFLVLDNDWQSRLTQGHAWAYGVELFLQKKVGKTTGWIGYTWSRNWRQFDLINGGIKYPFKYDRRHDFKVIATHQFSKNFTMSATWIYGTGNAITLSDYRYQLPYINNYNNGNTYLSTIAAPGERNAQRMKAYHRADIGFEWSKKKKHFERKWIIGIYNLYSRNNPFFIYERDRYNPSTQTSKTEYRQISIFPIIPSVSYEFKF
jgi:TonB-dependent Receptor Plug Domain/CarboxypepD_reg-like domain